MSSAQLARKEMITDLQIMLDQLRGVRFEDGRNSLRYGSTILLRGVLERHVAFDGN